MVPITPWHYPRAALARRYLRAFAGGQTSAFGLYAKRRTGKSVFLHDDLLPAAQAAGYRAAYATLWHPHVGPTTAIVSALAQALAPRGSAKLLRQLEALRGEDRSTTGPLLTALLEGHKPSLQLLLVLDDASLLAQAEHAELTQSLHASLDARRQCIKVVFAGSSRSAFRHLFEQAGEPFYGWAALEVFEPLGEDFVAAMVAQVNDQSRYPLELADALVAFQALERSPSTFQAFLLTYLVNAPAGWKAALLRIQELDSLDKHHERAWRPLLPADRSVLKLLAHGTVALQAASAREHVGRELRQTQVRPATVQNAVNRLRQRGLVQKLGYGHYAYVDDGFADWVRRQEPDVHVDP